MSKTGFNKNDIPMLRQELRFPESMILRTVVGQKQHISWSRIVQTLAADNVHLHDPWPSINRLVALDLLDLVDARAWRWWRFWLPARPHRFVATSLGKALVASVLADLADRG